MAAAAGEQASESQHECGQASRRAAAAAGANDGHQAIPSNRWARAFSAPSLRGTDRQSVPRNYSDLGVAGPESGASLPVSRRFQLIVSCNRRETGKLAPLSGFAPISVDRQLHGARRAAAQIDRGG